MTTIRLGITHDEPDGTPAQAGGLLEWKPSKRRDAGADVVLPDTFTVTLTAGAPAPTVEVPPNGPGWAWIVTERVRGGTRRHVTVPNVSGTVNYADLTDVDPATLAPTAQPEAAWWAALEALGGGTGGGTAVTDNGDGTLTLTTTTGAVTDNGDGTLTITG